MKIATLNPSETRIANENPQAPTSYLRQLLLDDINISIKQLFIAPFKLQSKLYKILLC